MTRIFFSQHHCITGMLTALFLLLLTTDLVAQNRTCDPVVKANRQKRLVVAGAYKSESLSFSVDGKDILIKYGSSRHTVLLMKNKLMLAMFTIEDREITSPVYAENDLNGNLVMTDSIDPVKGKHYKSYLDHSFKSHHVLLSKHYYPGNRPASAIYYSLLNGQDSVIKEWYTNGLLKSLRFKRMVPVDSVGFIESAFRNNDLVGSIEWQDSVSFAWDSTGILRRSSNPAAMRSYYPNGVLEKQNLLTAPWPSYRYSPDAILESRSRDTVLKGVLCRYQTTFHPTGIIQSEEFLCGGTPCYTWTSYSPEGKLKNRVYKGPLLASGIGLGVAMPPAPKEPYSTINHIASYPGSDAAYQLYMHTALTDVLCQNEGVMEGSYLLKFRVSETGNASFISFEGKGSDNTAALFSAVFSRMAPWHPARFNSRICNSVYTLELKIRTSN